MMNTHLTTSDITGCIDPNDEFLQHIQQRLTEAQHVNPLQILHLSTIKTMIAERLEHLNTLSADEKGI